MNSLIYKSGYLYKRSSSSDNKSRWQKRWFETIDTSTSYCLIYYKTSKKEKLLGVLHLSKIKEIQQAHSIVDYDDDDDDDDNDRLQLRQKSTIAATTTACSFNIILDNNNEYNMKGTSIHDVNDWIRILNRLKSAPVSVDGCMVVCMYIYLCM
jgi:hypothetical protein